MEQSQTLQMEALVALVQLVPACFHSTAAQKSVNLLLRGKKGEGKESRRNMAQTCQQQHKQDTLGCPQQT